MKSASTGMTPAQREPLFYIGCLSSSPIGSLWVAISDFGLARIDWDMPQEEFSQQVESCFHKDAVYDAQRTAETVRQLSEYLSGNLHHFSIPLDLSGLTAFQQQVLQLTTLVAYGQTTTYKELAIQAGKPNAARAVGRVEATNPIPIVIPCHRVVGSDGSLHGYGGPGGIKLKAWLLQLEKSGV